jgi:hypothetical protein
MRTASIGRHPEGLLSARPRTIRNLCLLVLFPALIVACEDLPAPPNLPPSASFFFTPVAPITAGQTPVTFNAEGSRDSDGTIATYTWKWGDSSAAQSTDRPTITHVFVDQPDLRCVEARYGVQLTVTDDKGASSSTSQQVAVIEAPAPGSAACR